MPYQQLDARILGMKTTTTPKTLRITVGNDTYEHWHVDMNLCFYDSGNVKWSHIDVAHFSHRSRDYIKGLVIGCRAFIGIKNPKPRISMEGDTLMVAGYVLGFKNRVPFFTSGSEVIDLDQAAKLFGVTTQMLQGVAEGARSMAGNKKKGLLDERKDGRVKA